MPLCVTCILLVGFQIDKQEDNQSDKEFRKVEVLAPSITCHSRFQDSLKSNIRDKHDWIKAVKVTNLGKRVLEARPKFDFGHDSVIVFEIQSNREVRELARILHRSGYYADTKLWHIRSGHKMKDVRDIPFSELLE